jgi:hypothetical protein
MDTQVRVIGAVRPTDRPSALYCRVCAAYKIPKFKSLSTNLPIPVPRDISTAHCFDCDTFGGLVWVEKPAKWVPVCGDPACQGTCLNPACIPPPKEEAPSRRSNGLHYFIAGVLVTATLEFLRRAFT